MDFPLSNANPRGLPKAVVGPVDTGQPKGKAFSMSCSAVRPDDRLSFRTSPDTGASEQTTFSGAIDINVAIVTGDTRVTDDEQCQNQPLVPDAKNSNSDSDFVETEYCPRCDDRARYILESAKYDQDFLDNYQLTGKYKLNLHELDEITSAEERIKDQEKRFIAGDYGENCSRELRSSIIKGLRQSLEQTMKKAEVEGSYQQRFTEKDWIHIIVFESEKRDNVRLKPEVVKKLRDEDPTIFDGMKSPHYLLPSCSSEIHSQAARYQPLAKLIADNKDNQSMIFEIPQHAPSCHKKKYDRDTHYSSRALPDALTCWSACSIPFPAYMNLYYEVKIESHYVNFQSLSFMDAEYELFMKDTREREFLGNFYNFLFGDEDSATPTVEPATSNALIDEREKTELTRLRAKFTLLRNMYPPNYDQKFTMDGLMANFAHLSKGPSRE